METFEKMKTKGKINKSELSKIGSGASAGNSGHSFNAGISSPLKGSFMARDNGLNEQMMGSNSTKNLKGARLDKGFSNKKISSSGGKRTNRFALKNSKAEAM